VSALPAAGRPSALPPAAADWARIEAAAPEAAAVMRRYLRQLGTFLAPASVDAADNALRHLARWMVAEAGLLSVGGIRRDHIEDSKVWLAARPRGAGRTITKETHRQRMRTVRQFFERIIELDWPDAPPRNPVIAMNIPKKPEPPPKFLDDQDAARLMTAARAAADPRDRLVMELLAETGMFSRGAKRTCRAFSCFGCSGPWLVSGWSATGVVEQQACARARPGGWRCRRVSAGVQWR
jgi:integrase